MMQTVTARIAAFLLDLSGVPAHLEGIFITTPPGYFKVAEACAGVKFLIAMIAFGALVAQCLLSRLAAADRLPGGRHRHPDPRQRRARLGHDLHRRQDRASPSPTSFDHVVYGGIFFAIVIALILAAGWRFFDRGVDDPWFDPAALPKAKRRARSA